MGRYLIDQVQLKPGYSRRTHQAIAGVSGVSQAQGVARWLLPVTEVIARIQRHADHFWMAMPDRDLPVLVALGPDGPFLRAHDGTTWTNALLALPDYVPQSR